MTGQDVKKKARAIADGTFGNRTMREMLYEDIMRACADNEQSKETYR